MMAEVVSVRVVFRTDRVEIIRSQGPQGPVPWRLVHTLAASERQAPELNRCSL